MSLSAKGAPVGQRFQAIVESFRLCVDLNLQVNFEEKIVLE
jgi:hypothetical protein